LNFAAVQGMALVLGRHAFISHPSISDLFEHPATAASSNVSWLLMTDEGRRQMEENTALVHRRVGSGGSNRHSARANRSTSALWRCGMSFKRTGFDTFADALTVGCNMVLVAHPEARMAMSQLLDLDLPVIAAKQHREEAEMVYGHLFKWLFSRPRAVLKSDDHLRRITSMCHHQRFNPTSAEAGSDPDTTYTSYTTDTGTVSSSLDRHTIDVAIQVRTFRDLHGDGYDSEFWSQEGRNYHECAASVVTQALRRARSAGHRGGLCVYVTSDYPSVSRRMQRALLGDARFRGERLAVVSHAEVHGDSGSAGDWHSGSALKASQGSEPRGQGRKWQEVLDWLAMSSAGAAVTTSSSTFGQTARYRTGYFESRHDYRVESPRNSSSGAQLCLPVHDTDQLCALCARLGRRCPLDAQRDCRSRRSRVWHRWG
jgi:hypothetical protein